MNFNDLELDDSLCQALAEIDHINPTSIQKLAIPHAMEQRDIMASAPTGTGKTAAFILPACQHLLDFPRAHAAEPRILILSPTRELALQIHEFTSHVIKHTSLRAGVITGGINYGSDKELLDQGLDILIATPGRLFEHIENEAAECRDIEWLILDEADRMLDMGFSKIVHQIAAEARWRKQTLLFSATLEGFGVRNFAKEILNDPVELEAESSRKEKAKTTQWYYLADTLEHKTELLTHLLKQDVETAIVFVKTRERVQWLVQALQSRDINCCYLRGEMPQDQRIKALAAFKNKSVNVLVATDVAARGIDVPKVSHVINFDLPRKADVYLHRVGRTGRAGAKGSAISLVEAHDFEVMGKISRYIGEAIKPRFIDGLRPKHKPPSIKKKHKKKSKTKK